MSNINDFEPDVNTETPRYAADHDHDEPLGYLPPPGGLDDAQDDYSDYIETLADRQASAPDWHEAANDAQGGGRVEPQEASALAVPAEVPYAEPEPRRVPVPGPLPVFGRTAKTAAELLTECSDALEATNPGVYYADESVSPMGAGIKRIRPRGDCQDLTEKGLWSDLQGAMTFAWHTRNQEVRYGHVVQNYATWLHSRPGEFFPPLRGVRHCGFLGPDAAVARKLGYYRSTHLYLTDPPGGAPVGPDNLKWLLDAILGDFTPKDWYSLLSATALVLEPILRPSILGPTPMHAVLATEMRAGKTYLATIAGGIATARLVEAKPLPKNEIRLPYSVAATLQASQGFVLLDNVSDRWTLDSPDFERILTARGPVCIRPARSGKHITVSTSLATWVLTGNGLSFKGGMARRVNPIHLLRQPSNRQFRHKDLHLRVLREHADVTNILLWPVEEWIRRGCPEPLTVFPSYPEWSAIVGGVLSVVADLLGLGGMSAVERWLGQLASQMSPEEAETVELFKHWSEAAASDPWRPASEVLAMIERLGLEVLTATFKDTPSAHGRVIRVGNWLMKHAESRTSFGTGWTLKQREGRAGNEYAPVPPKKD